MNPKNNDGQDMYKNKNEHACNHTCEHKDQALLPAGVMGVNVDEPRGFDCHYHFPDANDAYLECEVKEPPVDFLHDGYVLPTQQIYSFKDEDDPGDDSITQPYSDSDRLASCLTKGAAADTEDSDSILGKEESSNLHEEEVKQGICKCDRVCNYLFYTSQDQEEWRMMISADFDPDDLPCHENIVDLISICNIQQETYGYDNAPKELQHFFQERLN